MKTITLDEAYRLLDSSAAVVVNGVVTYANLDNLTGGPANEWCQLAWTDSEGNDYSVLFTEEPQDIRFDGTSLYMLDSEGDEAKITLLVPMGQKVEG